jgi:hypothetical protein
MYTTYRALGVIINTPSLLREDSWACVDPFLWNNKTQKTNPSSLSSVSQINIPIWLTTLALTSYAIFYIVDDWMVTNTTLYIMVPI